MEKTQSFTSKKIDKSKIISLEKKFLNLVNTNL